MILYTCGGQDEVCLLKYCWNICQFPPPPSMIKQTSLQWCRNPGGKEESAVKEPLPLWGIPRYHRAWLRRVCRHGHRDGGLEWVAGGTHKLAVGHLGCGGAAAIHEGVARPRPTRHNTIYILGPGSSQGVYHIWVLSSVKVTNCAKK